MCNQKGTFCLQLILTVCLCGAGAAPLNVLAQDFSDYDNFEDGSIQDEYGIELFPCQGPASAASLNEEGDIEMNAGFWALWCTRGFNDELIPADDEWSVRMLITSKAANAWGLGTLAYDNVTLCNNGRTLSIGYNSCTSQNELIPVPYETKGEPLYLQMDKFDGIVNGSLWKPGDAESLVQGSYPVAAHKTRPAFGVSNGTATFHDMWVASQPIPISFAEGDFNANGLLDAADLDMLVDNLGTDRKGFDLTGDGHVDLLDHQFWVKDVKNTWYGDANLDGEFNSGDLVDIFKAGEYEDAIQGNSTWSEGDWNADGDFSSGDLVTAFKDAGYEQGPRGALVAVPEPAGPSLLGVIGFALYSASRIRTRI
ncbi:MAG: hypothetical protein KDB27_34585 [Planctomycetales bacterium]|nr:hypothetical protein [Planctomycetales bacterium]